MSQKPSIEQLNFLRDVGAEIKSRRAPAYVGARGSEGTFFFVERNESIDANISASLGMRALRLSDEVTGRAAWQLECHVADHTYDEGGKTSIVHKYAFNWDDTNIYRAERSVIVRQDGVAMYEPMTLEARSERDVMGLDDTAIAFIGFEDDFACVDAQVCDDLLQAATEYLPGSPRY